MYKDEEGWDEVPVDQGAWKEGEITVTPSGQSAEGCFF